MTQEAPFFCFVMVYIYIYIYIRAPSRRSTEASSTETSIHISTPDQQPGQNNNHNTTSNKKTSNTTTTTTTAATMCKSYTFETQCVCESCGRPTAARRQVILFPTDAGAQLPEGASPGEACPTPRPGPGPDPEGPPAATVIAHRGIYPSALCRHTVKTQLRNATGKLHGALADLGRLVESDARLEFDAADAARARLRLAVRNLKEALDGDGDLPRARSLLDEVSRDAVIIRDRSERWEAARERVSAFLKGALDDARDAKDKAAAVFEGRFSPTRASSSGREN